MTEIVIRNAVYTNAGNVDMVWDSARNVASSATFLGVNYYAWSQFNAYASITTLLLGESTQINSDVKYPYATFDISDNFAYGNMFYYGSTYVLFKNLFIICRLRNNGKFGHIISYGTNHGGFPNSNPMNWTGVSLSIFHDTSGNHTYLYCRVGRNYKTVRTNNFNFNTIHTFSIENVNTVGQDVVFKWNNHTLCTISNIVFGQQGYEAYNCFMDNGNAIYFQIGAGQIAGFNLPFNSVLQQQQNAVAQCYTIGVGQITDSLMEMIFYRYAYSHVPLNINQVQTYTIGEDLGTVFGTTTNFSGNMQIL